MATIATFDEEVLDKLYTGVARSDTSFDTAVVGNPRAIQQRNVNRYDFVRSFSIEMGGLTPEEKVRLKEFFITKFGRAIGFRFIPPDDNEFLNDVLAIGDGTTTVFRLRRNYTGRFRFYSRLILKPVYPLVTITVDGEKVVIDDDGTDITPEGDFPVLAGNSITVDWNTGEITFATAPAADAVIRAAQGEYHVPVYFDTDKFSAEDYGPFADVNAMPLIEILPQALDETVEDIPEPVLAFAEPLSGTAVPPTFDVSFTSSSVDQVFLFIDGELIGSSTDGPDFPFADVERPPGGVAFRLEAVGTNASGQLVIAGIDLLSLEGTVYGVIYGGDPVTYGGEPVVHTIY